MSHFNRKFAAIFVVFAAIVVYQFSFLLAVSVLVLAVFIYQGFQMSDLRINVENSNRAQSLMSSLYSWTDSTISAVARKCKRLTIVGSDSRNNVSSQRFNSPRKSGTHQEYGSESENAVYNRENVYQGSNLMHGRRVGDTLQKHSNSPVNVSEWHRKSSNPNSQNLHKSFSSPNRCESEDIYSPRGSPWGYSLIPQQRNSVTDVRPVQAVAGPLIASSKYNSSRDSALYVDVNSPGFSSRLLKYHSDVAVHQPQYARPGQLPLVHLNTSSLPSLNTRNSQKVRAPVRVRIAPPSYDASESRIFPRADNQPVSERQSKSVIDVLKEISRKRINTEPNAIVVSDQRSAKPLNLNVLWQNPNNENTSLDGGSEPKRHHRSDSSSSSSSSSSPALVNGMITDQAPTGKRPREEDSPKLQKQAYKRTRNNEIYSSLSSSRNICVGTKRKAADNWSRCSTPAPLGKHLKQSPQPSIPTTTEAEDVNFSEGHPQKEQESLHRVKQTNEQKPKELTCLSPQSVQVQDNIEGHTSASSFEDNNNEEASNKIQRPKSHHGRLFVKAFSREIVNETENIKDSRRNGGSKPWKTHRTIDVDAITGEDIVRQDLDLGSRRLNSMFAVLQSAAKSADSVPKGGDSIDGHLSKIETSQPSEKKSEVKLDTPQEDKTLDPPSVTLAEKTFTSPKPAAAEVTSTNPEKDVPTSSDIPVTPLTTSSEVNNLPSPLTSSQDKQEKIEPKTNNTTLSPSTSAPVVTSSTPTTIATSTVFSLLSSTPSVPVTTQTNSPTSSTTSAAARLRPSLTVPSGIFGSSPTATFTVPQQSEKPPVMSTPSFSFGMNPTTNVSSPLASKSGFMASPSLATTASTLVSTSLPTFTSPFTSISSSPAATVANSSSVETPKPEVAASTVPGGFSFGTTSVTSTAMPSDSTLSKTTSAPTFGMSSLQTSTIATPPSNVPSLTSIATVTSSTTSLLPTKPTFSFGTATTTSAPTATTSTTIGYNFQFNSGTQASAPPKLQEAPGGFKFSFNANKETVSAPMNQASATPTSKPPAFGEGFNFGATSPGTISQENKPMTFGTPSSLSSTMGVTSSTQSTGGFSFSGNGSGATASLPKPTFGFGTSNPSSAANPSLSASGAGGFSFGAKPAEPAAVVPAPSAPTMATPFQFGTSSPAMPAAPTLQPQSQTQTMGSPFSIGGTTEQKPPALGGFSFGSPPSANMSNLQPTAPPFGQPSAPAFGSSTVSPLQSQPQTNTSLFQFGSGSGPIPQPGMSSGGFNFGGAPSTGAPSAGFNFNPSGPSANTPFQFGANPLQAPAMFSIGSGSTAPRSRARNRRQK